jgi:hypothetical protein
MTNLIPKCKFAEKCTKNDKTVKKSKKASIKDVKIEISNPKSETTTKQKLKTYLCCFLIYFIIMNNLFQFNL